MFTYTETEEIRLLVAELEALRERHDLSATLPRRWSGRLRRDLEVEAVAASTMIEGVRVTVDDVRRILVGDVPPHVTEEDAALVAGYRDAMSYVLRRADDPAFRWHSELLLAIHDRVLAGAYHLGVGRYRDGGVYLVDRQDGAVRFTPPDAEDVPELVDAAMDYVQRGDLSTPVAAAYVHAAVAAIHPFADGNGRTARICASLALFRGGFRRPEFTSLEEWWGRHPADYYAAFRALGSEWSSHADITPFVRAHIAAHVAQVTEYEERLEVQRDVWTALENICAEIADVRTADALYDAFLGRTVTNRYYRELAQVSPVTAASDLARLVAAGLLEVTGAGVSTGYVAAPALMERLAAELGLVGGPGPQVPPEETRTWIMAQLRWRVRER